MYHPLLLQPEVLRELPGLIDAPRRREDAAAEPCYRSEAFAEDLMGGEPTSAAPAPRGGAGWLYAAPLGTALVGAVLALFGQPM